MAQRVATPVNLKERIAALQQRAASTSPQASSSSSSSPLNLHSLASTPSLATAGFGAGLRDRIAKFEEKGGIPVPRGSFGLGAAPSREAIPYKRGELYGNRIPTVARPAGSQSPPSRFNRLGLGPAPLSDGRRSVSTSGLDGEDGRSVRKRCLSTPMLQNAEQPSFASIEALNQSANMLDAVQDETSMDIAQSTAAEDSLSTLAEPQTPPPNRLKRSSTISGGDAMPLSVVVDEPLPPLPPFPLPKLPADSPSPSLSLKLEGVESAELQEQTSANGGAPEVRTSPPCDAQDDGLSDSGSLGTHTASASQDAVMHTIISEGKEAEEHPQELELSIATDDGEDLSKTPVVTTFVPSEPSPCDTPVAESIVSETLSAKTDSSALPSPTTADSDISFAQLEIGKRAYAEKTKYIVIPPSTPSPVQTPTIASETSTCERNVPQVDEPIRISEKTDNALGVEHVDLPNLNVSPIPRPVVPAPITVQEEKYVEPDLGLKTGPKSFHAVVHGKKALSKSTDVSPAQYTPTSSAPAQVITVRQSVTDRFGPEPLTSPDLSDLLSQALSLEQRLLGGEEDIPKLSPTSLPKLDIGPKTSSTRAAVTLPRATRSEASGNFPSMPFPTSTPHTTIPTNRTSTRTDSSWSSSHASSEDSVSVITPPSPTFDLITPPLYADMKFEGGDLSSLQIKLPNDVAGIETVVEEDRRSFSSVLSSPGRSARKKLLSLSRSLGKGSRASMARYSHDDDTSSQGHNSESFPNSVSSSRPSTTQSHETTHPNPHHGRDNSLFVPLTIFPPTMEYSSQDRPLSTQTTSTASMPVSSPIDARFIDAFPEVPGFVPSQAKGAKGSGDLNPPPPPSKSPVQPSSPALPLTPPTPPRKDPAWQQSLRMSNSTDRPILPAGSLLSPHATPGSIADSPSPPRSLRQSSSSSVLSMFSRSLSSRSSKSHSSNSTHAHSRRGSGKHDAFS